MKDGMHVFWLRDRNRKPVTCVATQLEGRTLKYALATHNPHDKFNRATGRQKAVGRLSAIKNPPVTIVLPDDADPKETVLRSIITDQHNGPLTHNVAREAIDAMLRARMNGPLNQ